MNGLIQLNLHLITQVLSFTETLSEGVFSKPCKEVFSSTIGQHLRHCIEHYDAFIRAENSRGTLDYETRPRNPLIETNLDCAREQLKKIEKQLIEVGSLEAMIYVIDTGAKEPTTSSVSRELQYLISHTVHHFALISVIAGMNDQPLPENFGVAPSTLKYRAGT